MNHRKAGIYRCFRHEAASPRRVGTGKKYPTEGALATCALPCANGHDKDREKSSGVVGGTDIPLQHREWREEDKAKLEPTLFALKSRSDVSRSKQ